MTTPATITLWKGNRIADEWTISVEEIAQLYMRSKYPDVAMHLDRKLRAFMTDSTGPIASTWVDEDAYAAALDRVAVLEFAPYREVEPFGPTEGQDVGGDGQASQSWCRRFRRKLADDLFAVITVHFYVADERMRTANDDAPNPLTLERQTEYVLCRDPAHPDDEEFSDTRYQQTVPDAEPTEDAAKAACEALSADEFTWDGTTPVPTDDVHAVLAQGSLGSANAQTIQAMTLPEVDARTDPDRSTHTEPDTATDDEPDDEQFYVTVSDESEGAHAVRVNDEGDFECEDCGACGLTDGYLTDQGGAQAWHDDTTEPDGA